MTIEQNISTAHVALEALKVATQALTKINEHEKVDDQRWAAVRTVGLLLLATTFSVLGVLLYDKFF